MRVVIDGIKELCFDVIVDFKSCEFYEKLFEFCKLCFKFCYDEDYCFLNLKIFVKKKEIKDELKS